ncbi:MAG TPA: nuclear transport factor 2 family protein [Steroidobacteraceae bacterium]
MTSTIEANKALVHRYAQAVIDGDVATLEALQHPDVTWWVLGQGSVDRATFNALVRSGLIAARTRSLEILGITAEGDRVAYEAEGEMVFPDRVYRNRYHNLLVIRDGLIVQGREYMDTKAVAEAFGQKPV